jgi:hypothetical protein
MDKLIMLEKQLLIIQAELRKEKKFFKVKLIY